jgi:hypothetical protein
MPGFTIDKEDSFTNECQNQMYPSQTKCWPFTVFRVNWIRARSRQDRWTEELSMTTHEMLWVTLWFQHRAEIWRDWATSQSDVFNLVSPALKAYAYKQADNWDRLKEIAEQTFKEINTDFPLTFGYSSIIRCKD